ncbi:unnamed protein product [Pleuronectes platessa]|uniref:Uncharacterized protein n=1 Tax=Pleuronectes platessa TaxID=8262 RepID=A0A9N7U2Y5_PLEPL|nr:unnamed protein product [Pleuronectes platessa]
MKVGRGREAEEENMLTSTHTAAGSWSDPQAVTGFLDEPVEPASRQEAGVPGSIRPSTNRNTEKKTLYIEFRYLQLSEKRNLDEEVANDSRYKAADELGHIE